jgi:ubiquinone/menaquinone biosynthesis C-methylase UbiE
MGKRSEFDEFADNYRAIHTKNVKGVSGVSSDYFTYYKVQELLQVLPTNRSFHFLDLGCGDGNTARYMDRYFPSVQYHGIDISEQSIQVAKSHVLERCDFQVYDGVHIPYADESLDVVFMACVMHHVPMENRIQLLSEVWRKLKPNGLCIIFEHNPYNPVTRKLVSDCPFDKQAVLLSSGNLKDKLLRSGFLKKKEIRYTIFFPRKGLWKKFLPLESYLRWNPLGGQYYCIARK